MKNIKYLLPFLFFIGCATKKYPIDWELINSATKEKYKDVNAVILFDSTYTKVNKDGTYIATQHKCVKILSTYGKKKFGEVEFGYLPKKNIYVEVNLARVITADGKIIDVPKENIKDVPYAPLGKFLLSDVMMKKIMFPEIDIGASIEYIVTSKIDKAFMEGKFTDMKLFQYDEPINNMVYKIEFPKEMRIKYIVKNGEIDLKKEEKAENIIYTWEVNNVDRIIQEAMMPPIQTVAPILIISNIERWEDISQWYYNLTEEAVATIDSAIKAKVKELTEGLEKEEDKVRVLFNFVSKEVKYLRTEAIDKEKGFAPDPVSLTFQRKWGVCRDKAALLVSMLREVGISAYEVLINVSTRMIREIPCYLIEHAIVAIKRNDGSFYFLDPTVEYTQEYLPVIEQNRDVLICTKEGDSLRYLPYQNIEKNLIVADIKGSLDENGSLSAILILKPEGIFDTQLRNLRLVSPKEIKNIFSRAIKSQFPDATIDTIIISEVTDLTIPFDLEIHFSVPNYAIKKGDEFYIVSTGGMGLGNIGPMEGVSFLTEERKYPLYFWIPMKIKSLSEISLPKGYKIKEMPEQFDFTYEKFYITAKTKKVDNKLYEEREFFIKDPFIEVEEYPKFKEMMEASEKYNKKEIILVKEGK